MASDRPKKHKIAKSQPLRAIMPVISLFTDQQTTPTAQQAFCEVFDRRIEQMSDEQLRSFFKGFQAWSCDPQGERKVA